MKILVVGYGGREHAISWKLAQSALVEKIFLAPGNAGISKEKKVECVNISSSDFPRLYELCKENEVQFVVVGPDQALADGAIDFFQAKGILAFGPKKEAAQIEWSKAFSKSLMKEAGIPTANYQIFSVFSEAKKFLQEVNWGDGWVIKADGLALGKGVVVCSNREEAISTAQEFLEKSAHGEAGKTIVIEERLVGREVSHFALCDGANAVSLGFACDYKRIFDGDQGPNTGGMGAFSPADWLPENTQTLVEKEVVIPLMKILKSKGREYRGVLFSGLMITKSGPRVIEFNARFGDPETQCLLPLIDEDLLPWLMASAKGDLQGMGRVEIRKKPMSSVHVVLAAEGYPATPVKGDKIDIPIENLQSSDPEIQPKIFCAGIAEKGNHWITNGGRVFGVTALAHNREKARASAYQLVEKVRFRGSQRRSDVGK
jgi:phosphoribosylamine---glycine ligase